MKFYRLQRELKVSNKAGFSITEIFIVTVLIAAILSISVPPAINFFRDTVLNGQSNKIYAEVIALKNRSAVFKQENSIKIFPDSNEYLYLGAAQKLYKDVKFGFLKNSMGPPSNPIKKITSPCTFENNEIKINELGQISSGTIYLVDKDQKTMYAITSGISKQSYLRKYKYKNGGPPELKS